MSSFLGHQSSVFMVGIADGRGFPISIRNPLCKGDEQNILECGEEKPSLWGQPCQINFNMFVTCSNISKYIL